MMMKSDLFKATPTTISVYNKKTGNPVFDCFKISVEDEGAGSFLKLIGDDEANQGSHLTFDWDEWDAVVSAVEKYRPLWQTEEEDGKNET